MSDYDGVIGELRPHLREYIESQGVIIDNKGFFNCIHPDHPDKHPSCSLNKGNAGYEDQVFHCFSGNHSGNIFTAAHWLEGMSIHDSEFWTVTVAELCKRFGIEYKPIELSEDKKREYQDLKAIKDAVDIISSMTWTNHLKNTLNDSHVGVRHLLDRGITKETIRKFNIGVITSFTEYQKRMSDLGWKNPDHLQALGLLRKDIFRRNGFILPIYNIKGRPVGFVTRNTNHTDGDKESHKYINSSNSKYYSKGEILYNYNNVLKEPGPLYIVEGYIDAAYLHQCGMKKVAAIGATVITENHAEMLHDNETDICIALDGDAGGHAGVDISLERLCEYKKFNIRIVDMPHSYDPDTYVREKGLDSFLTLDTMSPFRWSLSKANYSEDLMVVAEKAVPIIAAERSSIGRLRMIQELSNFTSVPVEDIRRDVERMYEKEQEAYISDLRDLNEKVVSQLNRKKIVDTVGVLRKAHSRLTVIQNKYNESTDLQTEYLNRVQTLDQRIRNNEYEYGLLSPGFSRFQKTLDGVPHWANLILIAGKASSGKTAMVTALSLDLIKHNEDLAIFMMSIDDPTELMLQKIAAVHAGISPTEIKRYNHLDAEKRSKYEEAMHFIKRISDRYIIVDAKQGTTVDDLENNVNYFCKNFPDKKKLFILDNFHKLDLKVAGTQSRTTDGQIESSGRIKDMTTTNDIPIICTVELRKLEGEFKRPTRNDMYGAAKLDYDADVVCLLHNDKQVKEAAGQRSQLVHNKNVDDINVEMPYVELNIAKNKLNGAQNYIPYKYNSYNMQFDESTKDEWETVRNRELKSSKNTLNFSTN